MSSFCASLSLPLPATYQPFPPGGNLHFQLVYKISESCANKPQRRLHLIYLQQNVQKLKLLRKCNFALRVFRIRIRIRAHHLAAFQHVRTCGRAGRDGAGGRHATRFLATANTKAAAGSRLNWKGCGKEYETRRRGRPLITKGGGGRERGEQWLQMEAKSMCLCEPIIRIPCKMSAKKRSSLAVSSSDRLMPT